MLRTFNTRLLTACAITGASIMASATAMSTPAFSLAATGTINVTASLAESCTVNTENLAFGQLAYGANATVDGGFTVNCLEGTVYTIAINDGLNYDPANSKRRMAHTTSTTVGGVYIPYTLYDGQPGLGQEVTTNYTAGSLGLIPGTYTGSSLDQVYDLWAAVQGSDTTGKETGSYADTIVVTIAY